ncbi:hypothetical protein OSSY52_21970 [Tepiditoga spiralis]|uniref:Uncharacterized protein n=1 Tax=Tepiditoga spiralis TaxID=2108365 RepID=A0A7G1G999_9BACT|nr:hypothetical protein [Tepiditoga spiralis]BBE32056.1 hypothetical protein OSSY52_21970 [Tepiditoga spiralis]
MKKSFVIMIFLILLIVFFVSSCTKNITNSVQKNDKEITLNESSHLESETFYTLDFTKIKTDYYTKKGILKLTEYYNKNGEIVLSKNFINNKILINKFNFKNNLYKISKGISNYKILPDFISNNQNNIVKTKNTQPVIFKVISISIYQSTSNNIESKTWTDKGLISNSSKILSNLISAANYAADLFFKKSIPGYILGSAANLLIDSTANQYIVFTKFGYTDFKSGKGKVLTYFRDPNGQRTVLDKKAPQYVRFYSEIAIRNYYDLFKDEYMNLKAHYKDSSGIECTKMKSYKNSDIQVAKNKESSTFNKYHNNSYLRNYVKTRYEIDLANSGVIVQ